MRSMTLHAAMLLLMASLAAAAEDAGPIRFRDRTKEAGLYEPLAGIMGHGGAWGDFDGDGLIDLFVGGFCDRPDSEYKPAAGPVPSRLLRNLGNGTFQLVKDTPASFFGRTSGAVFADLDNNGTLELYAANNAKQRTSNKQEPQRSAQTRFSNFFRNERGKLIDISRESGVCPENLYTARNIGVLDYDGDGLLDLFVVEDTFTKKPRSALFRNLGGLKFEDVTKAVGLPEDIYGLGLAVADLNGDGRPDIFVPHSNRLFLSDLLSRDPKGERAPRYREVAQMRDMIAWKPAGREDWPCGAAFGDLNRDGKLDLVIAIHCSTARNVVLLNEGLKDGVPQFRNITKEAGLGDTIPVRCPHVEIQDFDNDGWPDIYISAAWLDEQGNGTPLVYRNLGVKDGTPRFVLPRPIDKTMVYYPAGPSGDYDNDGRLDLFLINWFQGNHSRLLHNESATRSWLQVQVAGTKQLNRMGIGAQVKIYPAGEKMLLGFQEISTGYGYASGQPAYAHFGLGEHKTVDVEVRFPNGASVVKSAVAANRRLTVTGP